MDILTSRTIGQSDAEYGEKITYHANKTCLCRVLIVSQQVQDSNDNIEFKQTVCVLLVASRHSCMRLIGDEPRNFVPWSSDENRGPPLLNSASHQWGGGLFTSTDLSCSGAFYMADLQRYSARTHEA
ncbi:hypothetical protein TNCV_288561 [Trichonephila clavipes]|nr:hypothetical protein TNCV_288561 [Trichonephila clavipes]